MFLTKRLLRIESVSSRKPDDNMLSYLCKWWWFCQGFSHSFEFDNKIKDDDKVLNFENVKVLIIETSPQICENTNFVEDMIGSYFKITNPNATSTCGCGTSFSVYYENCSWNVNSIRVRVNTLNTLMKNINQT